MYGIRLREELENDTAWYDDRPPGFHGSLERYIYRQVWPPLGTVQS